MLLTQLPNDQLEAMIASHKAARRSHSTAIAALKKILASKAASESAERVSNNLLLPFTEEIK